MLDHPGQELLAVGPLLGTGTAYVFAISTTAQKPVGAWACPLVNLSADFQNTWSPTSVPQICSLGVFIIKYFTIII